MMDQNTCFAYLNMELPDDIRVQIESMLLDKTISYKEIADWATDSGYPISKSAIGRYAQRTALVMTSCTFLS